ncbi:acyltransferase domain-containing protein, partial [Streptomyces sp. NPDC052101]|uniref:acyltransferase domain-containing protein n=1 Tax=Streptomyces sp. NPDC052101 TaxID=3155763 RepID=UPI003433FCB5
MSGRSEAGLRGQAARLREFAAVGEVDEVSVARSLVMSRASLEHRAVVVAGGREELLAGLEAVAGGESAAQVVSGTVAGEPSGAVFVFPGQGSQWLGMAAELLECSPVFAETIEQCAAALAPYVEWDLSAVLRDTSDGAALERDDVVQPALWAVMVSLAALWRSLGVEPSAVIGHSQGEIAAACVSGALSLQDGARLVALRSQVIAKELAGRGGMLWLATSSAHAGQLIAGREGVWVAALNGPSATVVAGDLDALDEVRAECEQSGLRTRTVPINYASHTQHLEQVRDQLLEAGAFLSPRSGDVPMYSTVTGERVDGTELDAEYWYRNLREPVRFAQTVTALMEQGSGVFVEVSAHPVLAGALGEVAEAAGTDLVSVGTLRRDQGGLGRVVMSLAELWVRGVEVDWTAVVGEGGRVDLPTYAFQRERFWLSGSAGVGDVGGAGLSLVGHPLLAAGVSLADGGGLVFTGRLSLAAQPWLADHVVSGRMLVPGAALVELVLRAGEFVGCDVVGELVLQSPLVVPDAESAMDVQVTLGEADEQGQRAVRVFSRVVRDGWDAEWTCHAEGTVAAGAGDAAVGAMGQWPPADATAVDVDGFYERLAEWGYGYGPVFQGVRAVWRRGEEVFAEVELPESAAADAERFGVHPALIDAAQQSQVATAFGQGGEVEPHLPFSFTGVRVHATGATAARVRVRPNGDDTVSVLMADSTGQPVLTIDSLVSRPVAMDAGTGTTAKPRVDSLFEVEWAVMPVESADGAGLLGDVLVLRASV